MQNESIEPPRDPSYQLAGDDSENLTPEPLSARELALTADEVIGRPIDPGKVIDVQQRDLTSEIGGIQSEIDELVGIINGPDERLGDKDRLMELRQQLVDARVELGEAQGGQSGPEPIT